MKFFPRWFWSQYTVGFTVVALMLGGGLARAGSAQVAEVPLDDANGDFSSAILQGNRGFYPNERWVVVAPHDDPLNCRYSPNGPVRAVIIPGAIVTAKFGGPVNLDNGLRPNLDNDAIALADGRPWLRIWGQAAGLAYPAARPPQSDALGECYVRANVRYIAPLNNEAAIQ